MKAPKVGFVFFSRKRVGFSPEWGAEVEGRVRAFASAAPFEVFVAPTKPLDDASLRAALAECRAAGVEVPVILQTTMSDGRLAPVLQQQWGDPVVLWATPEPAGASKVGACALVGAHTFGALYAQMGVPFQFIYGMPGDQRFDRDFADAVFAASARGRLRRSKIGLIGRHAPGFLDMEIDPFVLHRVFGTQLHHSSLHEFMDRVHALDAERVAADVKHVRSLGLPCVGVTGEDLEVQSRFYLALRDLAAEESLDAAALRCWSELPNISGQWAYLALVRLVSENFPAAMEGDADGALTCLIGEFLGMGAGFLSDWLEHDDKSILLWHPGNAPLQMVPAAGTPGGSRLAHHFNVPKPTVVESVFPAGMDLTLFRFWRVGESYRFCCIEGTTTPVENPLAGTHANFLADDGNLFDRFDTWLHAGFPHHIAVFQGRHARRLRRLAPMFEASSLKALS